MSGRLTAFFLAAALASPAAAQDMTPEAIMSAWLASPHAATDDPAFTHWNEEGAIPENCAVCHSGPGYLDFVGADGSEPGVVNAPAPTQEPIDCQVCHVEETAALETVTFPSGATASDLGSSTVCFVCHQGRESSDSVEAATASLEPDAVSPDLAFLNIHYRAAGATLLGSQARGGYQYDGRDYAGRFDHVPDFASCTDCHDPHSLEVAVEPCQACHQGIDELGAIRATEADLDGDGNTTEGIVQEIATIEDRLLAAIQRYAAEVAGTPIVYAEAYPYFFTDTDGDGAASEEEAAYPNRYASWTPRLLRAAYNYQFAAKDPGGYAHNPHYVTQLLYDSLASLGESVEVETADLVRP